MSKAQESAIRENTSTLVRIPGEKAMLILTLRTATGWNQRHRHLLPRCSTSIHRPGLSSGTITLICWHMPVRVSTMRMASICWPVWSCIKMPLMSIISRLHHSHLLPPSPTIHHRRMWRSTLALYHSPWPNRKCIHSVISIRCNRLYLINNNR